MIEVGNGDDFNCAAGQQQLQFCQAHFALWTIMKVGVRRAGEICMYSGSTAPLQAPLILGNDIPAMGNATFSVLSNTYAISVNQVWGASSFYATAQRLRARCCCHMRCFYRIRWVSRVAVSLSSSPATTHSLRLCTTTSRSQVRASQGLCRSLLTRQCPRNDAAQCNASRPTQQWTWTNTTSVTRNLTYLVPCDASDPFQQWSFVGPAGATVLKNAGSGKCIDASAQWDPAQVRRRKRVTPKSRITYMFLAFRRLQSATRPLHRSSGLLTPPGRSLPLRPSAAWM